MGSHGGCEPPALGPITRAHGRDTGRGITNGDGPAPLLTKKSLALYRRSATDDVCAFLERDFDAATDKAHVRLI